MDKNYGDIIVGAGEVGFVIYTDPLAKAEFFDGLVSGTRAHTVYVDFDLMYSGHVASGLLPMHDGVQIIVPEHGNARKAITEAIWRASEGRCLVVIDSLNGMRRACKDDDSSITNSALMMLASFARQSGSSVLISCAAIQDSESEWWLSPLGGRIANLGAGVSKMYVKPADGGIKIDILADSRSRRKTNLP